MYCSQKGCRIFGVPRCNAAPLLQLKDGILDQAPKLIEVFVIHSLFLTVLFGLFYILEGDGIVAHNKAPARRGFVWYIYNVYQYRG